MFAARMHSGPILARLLLIVVILVVAGRAGAEERAARGTAPPIRVIVEAVGPDAEETKWFLVSALEEARPDAIAVVDGARFRASLRSGNQSVATILSGTPSTRISGVERAARSSHADAVVLAKVERPAGGEARIRVLFVAVHAGTVPVDRVLTREGRRSTRADRTDAAAILAVGLEDVRPAPAATRLGPRGVSVDAVGGQPASASDLTSPASSPSDAALGAVRRDVAAERRGARSDDVSHALFQVSGAIELFSRHFDYNDRLTPTLRSYTLDAAPMLSLAGEIYPLARLASGFARDIGLAASYRRAVALDSATEANTSQSTLTDGAARSTSTSFDEVVAGARVRLRIGHGAAPPVLYFSLLYGAANFSVSNDDPAIAAESPSANYRFLSVGTEARWPLGPVSILAGAAYRGVLSADAVADRFARASVAGVDGHLGVAMTLSGGFEARLAARYTRYSYSFSPEPGDRYVAGGALDEYPSALLALAYAQ